MTNLLKKELKNIHVVLDAGHGGTDPGAVNSKLNLKEKDLNLKVVHAVKDALLQKGIKVTLTRSTDVYLNLSKRSQISDLVKADLFISFHINAGGGVGFETFIYNGRTNELTETIQKTLHEGIYKHLKALGVKDRKCKKANYSVLRETDAPAVLIENLFIDSTDADLLKKQYDKVVEANVKGILEVFGIVEKKATQAPKQTEKAEGIKMVKIIHKGSDGVNVRNKANFLKSSVVGIAKEGEAFTIASELKDFYKLKSGLYITKNEKYVTVITK